MRSSRAARVSVPGVTRIRAVIRLVVVIALGFLAAVWPVTSSATIAQVQSSSQFSTSGAASITSAAFATNPVAGNRIVVIAWAKNTSSAPTLSASDSKGNTYASRAQTFINYAGVGQQAVAILDATVATTGASFTVTVTSSVGSTAIEAVAIEYSGIASVDQTNATTGTGSPLSISTTATTSAANSLVVSTLGIVRNGPDYTAITPGSGFTQRAVQLHTASTYATGSGEDKTAVSAGVQTNTWTPSYTSGNWGWAAAIVTYTPVSQPPAPTCGALGSAATYPVYGSTSLATNSGGTVSNGTSTYSVSKSTGSGQAIDQNSGAKVTPSPAPSLPPLSPATFPANASTSDSSATSLNPGSYRTVTVAGTTNFAAGIYYINTLTVNSNATVNFGPGTYYVGSLNLGQSGTLSVSSGAVRLNIGTTASLAKSTSVNAGGSASALQVVLYPGAGFTSLNPMTFTGLLYGPDSTNAISVGDSANITGAVIGTDVTLGKNFVITYSPAVQAALSAVSSCSPGTVDHYQLVVASTALACAATTATVTACADSSSPCTNAVTTLAGQTATLATSAGSLGATTLTFDATGAASTTLNYVAATDGAIATVTLSNEQSSASSARQCCPNGSNCSTANSCSITFSTAGFIIAASANGAATTLPTQTAGTASSSYVLRAVKTNTTTKACEGSLVGANTVNWALQCNNPTTCSAGTLMSVNGGTPTAIAGNPNASVSSYTSVPMTFDANGNASFTFTYADVGQTTLWATKTVNSTTLSGSSNAFVTKPAGFTLSNIRQTASPNLANPAAASASGSKFVTAGESFSATVTAVTSGGAATPNYGRETSAEGVQLTPALVLPAGGATGTLSNATLAGGSFSNGVATVTTLAFSEVGIITLTPSVADADYLGAGNVTGTTSANVGRFVPARFALSAASVTHRSSLSCSPASGFTYLGENFRLGLTLTAQNASGATTQNYTGTFAKLDPTSASGWNVAGLGGTTTFSTGSGRLSLGSATGSWSNGVAAGVTLVANASRAAAADGPFAAAFGVAPTDSDGVAMASFDMASTAGGVNDRASVGTVALRFGRLRLVNAVGAQTRTLALPLIAQYWTGSAFDTNTLDSCTTVPASAVSFGNLRKTLTAGDATLSGGSAGLAAGVGTLRLAAPSSGHYGSVDVALSLGSSATDSSCLQTWTPATPGTAGANLAFLRGAWCGSSYDKDPAARASLGLYRGADAVIDQRENY